jgi:choline dehydrogenase-like flavoprotein
MGDKASVLGVPIGCSNIHVVDSSIFPSVAAGPITFTVMANAMRIARESLK